MAKNIAIWCLAIPLAALFLLAGAGKFGADATANFQKFGYSDAFRVFIGIAEVAGGIGLLFPRVAAWAAWGLVAIMAGAVYTHVAVGINIAFPAVVGALLAGVAVLRHKDALLLSSPRPPALGDTAASRASQRPAA
jgi:putative oxidoreductase